MLFVITFIHYLLYCIMIVVYSILLHHCGLNIEHDMFQLLYAWCFSYSTALYHVSFAFRPCPCVSTIPGLLLGRVAGDVITEGGVNAGQEVEIHLHLTLGSWIEPSIRG